MGLGDDIVYVSLLVTSIAISHYLRKVKNTNQRQYLSTFIGFIVVFIVSGKHVLYPIITIAVNYFIIILFNRRSAPWISLIFCFIFLTFFRISSFFNLDPPPDHTNAVMMILCLKMVGLAFEIHSNSEYLKIRPEIKDVSSLTIIDCFHYGFCLAGVLVGPYYRYRTYLDSVNCPYEKLIPFEKCLKNRMQFLPFYTMLFLLSRYLFPVEFVATDAIWDKSLLYRLFYMWPIFFTFRMRMYLGFILGECVCIMAGIGCYPQHLNPRSGQGPEDYNAYLEWRRGYTEGKKELLNFETICNVKEFQCEFLGSMRDGMRNWNMTVQYWLAMIIYKQFPVRALKVAITMLTSALWHGLNPGYYLCLMNVPLVLLAQDKLDKALKGTLSSTAELVFKWINWFLSMSLFSYLSTAFLLLNLSTSLFYWRSIYFFGHLVIILIYASGHSIAIFRNTEKNK